MTLFGGTRTAVRSHQKYVYIGVVSSALLHALSVGEGAENEGAKGGAQGKGRGGGGGRVQCCWAWPVL